MVKEGFMMNAVSALITAHCPLTTFLLWQESQVWTYLEKNG